MQTTSFRLRSLLVLAFAAALAAPSPTLPAEDLAQRVEREAIELHDFLEDWFSGRLPETDAAFKRFADAIGESFVIVSPDGSLLHRQQIVEAVRRDHGRWKNDSKARIEVRNAKLHHHEDGIAVATYEEWQTTSNGTVTRLSSVVFSEDPEAPAGLVWVHLSEVWMNAP